jgi:hypothetical protein
MVSFPENRDVTESFSQSLQAKEEIQAVRVFKFRFSISK